MALRIALRQSHRSRGQAPRGGIGMPALPGYFTIDVTASGKKVGMLSVNQTTGAAWYHTWHGGFLADQDF